MCTPVPFRSLRTLRVTTNSRYWTFLHDSCYGAFARRAAWTTNFGNILSNFERVCLRRVVGYMRTIESARVRGARPAALQKHRSIVRIGDWELERDSSSRTRHNIVLQAGVLVLVLGGPSGAGAFLLVYGAAACNVQRQAAICNSVGV